MSSKGGTATLDLKWQIEDIGSCRKKLIVEVAASEVNRAFEASYSELASAVQMPGFRKGRAPRDLIEKRFAAEVSEEVAVALVPTAIEQSCSAAALNVMNISPFDVEKIVPRKGEPLRFEVEVEVEPEITVGQYKGLEVKQTEAIVFEDEIEAAIRKMMVRAGAVCFADVPEVSAETEVLGTMTIEREEGGGRVVQNGGDDRPRPNLRHACGGSDPDATRQETGRFRGIRNDPRRRMQRRKIAREEGKSEVHDRESGEA